MLRRALGALALGAAGVSILVSLGVWQVRRLEWKEGMLAAIESRIAAPPADLPAIPDPASDRYRSVAASGDLAGPAIRVLVSPPGLGPGCRILMAFSTGGRRLLVDRGFVPSGRCKDRFPGGPAAVTGNLLWPDEVDSFTPGPEADWREGGLWFARDLPAMAQALGTEPLLIVARSETGDGIRPLPVGTEGIPNDHLQYALTWFSLAAVWAGMTGLMLWRIARRTA